MPPGLCAQNQVKISKFSSPFLAKTVGLESQESKKKILVFELGKGVLFRVMLGG